MEIGNISPCPVALYAMEGIAQMEFHLVYGNVDQSYKDKAGKYDRQSAEPVPARVKE